MVKWIKFYEFVVDFVLILSHLRDLFVSLRTLFSFLYLSESDNSLRSALVEVALDLRYYFYYN